MSAHVLLNILSELRISNDRLAEHFIVFCKEFKSSNKKHMLEYIYHMTLILFFNIAFRINF